jgi:cell division protein FtsW (lipid II flippase)
MPWRLIYAGVALTTAGLLVIELSLTRLFSVIFYSHFAFLAISIALFGLGIGGVLSYAFSARPETVFKRAGWLSLLNAVSVVGAVAVLVLPQQEPDPRWLAVTYFVTALPFMFGGATVSLVLSAAIERVDRVYFFDLLGAAAGTQRYRRQCCSRRLPSFGFRRRGRRRPGR